MFRMTLGIIVSAILLSLSAQTRAAAIFYTDEADFLAAAGSPEATMTFEGVAAANSLSTISGPYTEDGITLSNLGLIVDDGYGGGIYDIGTGASGQIFREVISTVSYVGGSVYAGGTTVFTVQASGDHAVGEAYLGLSTGETGSVATSNINGESFFIGFVSDTPVDTFSLFANTTPNPRWLEVDNILVTTTSLASLPAPNTAWLFGLGLAGLLWPKRQSLTSKPGARRKNQS